MLLTTSSLFLGVNFPNKAFGIPAIKLSPLIASNQPMQNCFTFTSDVEPCRCDASAARRSTVVRGVASYRRRFSMLLTGMGPRTRPNLAEQGRVERDHSSRSVGDLAALSVIDGPSRLVSRCYDNRQSALYTSSVLLLLLCQWENR